MIRTSIINPTARGQWCMGAPSSEWVSRFVRPIRHTMGHFGGGNMGVDGRACVESRGRLGGNRLPSQQWGLTVLWSSPCCLGTAPAECELMIFLAPISGFIFVKIVKINLNYTARSIWKKTSTGTASKLKEICCALAEKPGKLALLWTTFGAYMKFGGGGNFRLENYGVIVCINFTDIVFLIKNNFCRLVKLPWY